MTLQQYLYFFSTVLSIISGFILAVNSLKDRIREISITFKSLKSALISILIFTSIILLIITLIVTIICFIAPFSSPTHYYEGPPRFPHISEPIIPASPEEIDQGRQEAFKLFKNFAFWFYTYVGLATVPIICFLFITLSVQKLTNLVINYLINPLCVVLALICLVLSGIIYVFAIFFN